MRFDQFINLQRRQLRLAGHADAAICLNQKLPPKSPHSRRMATLPHRRFRFNR